jgi:hypothetical protein
MLSACVLKGAASDRRLRTKSAREHGSGERARPAAFEPRAIAAPALGPSVDGLLPWVLDRCRPERPLDHPACTPSSPRPAVAGTRNVRALLIAALRVSIVWRHPLTATGRNDVRRHAPRERRLPTTRYADFEANPVPIPVSLPTTPPIWRPCQGSLRAASSRILILWLQLDGWTFISPCPAGRGLQHDALPLSTFMSTSLTKSLFQTFF